MVSPDNEYQRQRLEMITAQGHIDAGKALKGIWPAKPLSIEELEKTDILSISIYLQTLQQKAQTQPLSLLDAACGNGTKIIPLADYLAERTLVDLTLVDMQPEALESAQKLTGELQILPNLKVNYLVFDLVNYESDPDQFDGISFMSALHFMNPDQELKALQNLAKGLKPGGIFYGSVCSIYNQACFGLAGVDKLPRVQEDTKNGTTDIPYASEHRTYGTMYFHTKYSIEKLVHQAGLEPIRIEGFRNNSYPNGLSDQYPENIGFVATKTF